MVGQDIGSWYTVKMIAYYLQCLVFLVLVFNLLGTFKVFSQSSLSKSVPSISMEEWEKTYGLEDELKTLNQKKYNSLRLKKNFDQRSFLDLYATFSNPSGNLSNRAIKEVGLLKYNFDSPLYPYKMDLIERYASPADKEVLRDHLYRYHQNNCVAKKFLSDDLSSLMAMDFRLSTERHRKILTVIGSLTNQTMAQQMERRYLSGMLRSQPTVLQNLRAEEVGLQHSIVQFPYVFRKKLGLSDRAAKVLFDYDVAQIATESCQAKEKLFSSTFFSAEFDFPSDVVEKRADNLFDCYKAKSTDIEIDFLSRFIKAGSTLPYKSVLMSALHKLGYCYWRKDLFDESLKALVDLESLADKYEKPRWKYESWFLRARLAENRFDFKSSIQWFEKIIGAKDHQFDEWEIKRQIVLNSIMQYRISPESKDVLDRFLKDWYNADKNVTNYWFAGFINYWFGKYLESAGSKLEAVRSYKRAAIESFDTFEAAVSNYIVDLSGEKSPLALTLAENAGEIKLLAPQSTELDSDGRAIETALFLREFGIKKYSSCAVDRSFSEDMQSDGLRLAAQIQSANRNYLESIKLFAKLSYIDRVKFGASLYRFIFPMDFKEEILTHAAKSKVEASLVFSLIRQESVFNPVAQSQAGARGLMQLTHGTAKIELSRMSSDVYSSKWIRNARSKLLDPSSLFDESLNIAIGIHHLGSLKTKFADNLVDTLASYNAGHMALAKWRDKILEPDPLLFVESIPYSETRKYIKLILRNYYFYSRLHFKNMEKLSYLDAMLVPLKVP